MFFKIFVAIFLVIFSFTISFAQNENQWEYLEVSEINNSYKDFSESYRFYKYLNRNISFRGESALDRIGKAGWELVGVVNSNSEGSAARLIFKRKYNKEHTDEEIKELKKWELSVITDEPAPSRNFNIIDVDLVESNQTIVNYNRSQEQKLRNILEKIKDLPFRIVSVKSNSKVVGQTALGAELVVDATKILLKDNKTYSSSETEKYFREVLEKIINQIPLEWLTEQLPSQAKAISEKGYRIQIGDFNSFSDGIYLKTSLVIEFQGQENVVDVGYLRFKGFVDKPK